MELTEVKQKTKRGVFWNTFEKFSVQIIGFIMNIILARLLTPGDYGTIGLLTVFITLSNVFIESGFIKALIQNQSRTEKDLSTVFFLNLFISFALYLALYFLAPLLAKFYKIPLLTDYSRILFLILIFNALTIVQNTILQIKIEFKKIAFVNVFATFISGLIGIICACNGYGAWSIVIKSLANIGIACVLFLIVGKWVPHSFFSYTSFKKLFGFSSKLLVGRILSETHRFVNNLIIGKTFSTSDLGVYTRSQQFPELISGTLNTVIGGTTFPLLSTLQNDKTELIDTLKKMICLTGVVIFPLMFGLSALSKPLITLLLGEKWIAVIPYLQILAVSYVFLPINCLNANVLQVTNNAGKYLIILIFNFFIKIITMIITVRISLYAVVVGQFINSVIYYLLVVFLIGFLFGFGFLKQLKCILPYFIVSLIMFGLILSVNSFISSDLLKLIIGFLIGVIFYISASYLIRDEYFLMLVNGILKKRTPDRID